MPTDQSQFFSAGGKLSESLPEFQPRQAQQAMAAAVDKTLDKGGRLMAEAGTGVGKSLAYLVPLIAAARRVGQPAVVSTHTLNLQRQLLDKDIPLALKVLDQSAQVVRAMGRANYFCHLRYSLVNPRAGMDLLPGVEAGPLEQLADWAQEQNETVRDRLPSKVDDALWEKVNVDPYGCPGHQCPHAQRCFFLKERNAMAKADLVLANHALVLSDLAARRQGSMVLPDAAFLVIDEAHHLETIAADHLGLRLGASMLKHQYNFLDDGRGQGLLARADSPLAARDALEICREQTSAFFEMISLYLPKHAVGASIEADRPLTVEPPLVGALLGLASALGVLRHEAEDEALSAELAGSAARLRQAGEGLQGWASQQLGDSVYWLEWNGRESAVHLRSAPLDVGPLLAEELYARHHAVVLTSATLSAGGNFAFMKSRLGLDDKSQCLTLASPFDYLSKVQMHLSASLPDPGKDEEAWLAALPAAIQEHLEQSAGRAFVLFTAYRHLEQCAEAMEDWIQEQGWTLLVQSRGANRERLLNTFRQGNAVLMGTASFWEGVDVPGEALSSVIVAKLPFNSPYSPLEQARARRVEEAGGSYFKHLSLPEAQLRLKQGFGRLIRHENDQGWFAVLDSRMIKKNYGRSFLKSLPVCRTFVDGEEIERDPS